MIIVGSSSDDDIIIHVRSYLVILTANFLLAAPEVTELRLEGGEELLVV